MMEAIKSFIDAFDVQDHLQPLIQNADIQVLLCNGEQSIHLAIKDGQITFSKHHDITQTMYEISGSTIGIKKLLEGKERLRVLQTQGQLNFSGPLRKALLLESIFYLAKAEKLQTA